MSFKTKVAYSAVLATLGLAAGSAQAAYLSEEGTGQVLLYPYYSVQGGMDTYITVVNTNTRSKAVKVRFLEGRGSNEVLDFNLYLSAKDVWNAAVTTSDAANPLAAAKIVTNDKSCTVPAIPAGGQSFRNTQYSLPGTLGLAALGTGLERTREGYVEIIEMGVPDATDGTANGTHTFEWSVTHNSAGVPNDCAWVQNQFSGLGAEITVGASGTAPKLLLGPRTGGLIGTGTLINVNQGVDYSYDPVAIEDYNTTGTNLHYTPGSLSPSLSQAETSSAIIDGVGAGRRLVTTNWTLGDVPGLDAISAVLMRNHVMNEYTIDPDLAAGTDWVITFPTKSGYVNVLNQGVAPTPTIRPFTKGAGASTSSTWLACEPATFTRYNREEAVKGGSIDFSPSTTVGTSLCYESNVITFANKNVLGSVNVKNNIDDVFANGWIDLSFSVGASVGSIGQSMVSPTGASSYSNATTVTLNQTPTYVGLPVIGFAVQKYVNGTFNGAVGNYGGAYAHKYVRTIR